MHLTTDEPITAERHPLAIGVIGGATTVVDYGGLRFITDPTFDPPGDYGPYRKTSGPAIAPQDVSEVDAVLLSHDQQRGVPQRDLVKKVAWLTFTNTFTNPTKTAPEVASGSRFT